MTVKLRKLGYTSGGSEIASNSLSVLGNDLLTINAAGFVAKAVAAEVIDGVALGEETFDVDNQTVARAKIDYLNKQEAVRVELTATTAFTQAMVGDRFNITAAQLADVATAGTGVQVELEDILNSAGTRGSFKFVIV